MICTGLVPHVRQQRHLASPLDRHCDLPLVLAACAADAAGADLAFLRDVPPELVDVLVVDLVDLVLAEEAALAATACCGAGGCPLPAAIWLRCHPYSLERNVVVGRRGGRKVGIGPRARGHELVAAALRGV